MNRPMVEKVLRILRRGCHLPPKGTPVKRRTNIFGREVITHASRPEGPASYMAARRLSKKMYKNSKNPKLHKNQTIAKYELCNLYILQNKRGFLFIFRFFQYFSKISKVIWQFWSILYNKSLFRISDSDSVYFSVYGNML